MRELRSSVLKTFAILEFFTAQKTEWGVTELASAAGSNKSTVYRFLADLEQLGILHKNPLTEKYSLGLKLFELGNRVPLKSAFVNIIHPELVAVARRITETVHMAMLKNQQVFFVDKVESPQGLRISSHIGSYSPAYATALGKVLLAFLPEDIQLQTLNTIMETPKSFTRNTITDILPLKEELANVRAQQYAIDREEFEIGLICVAIPVFNQKSQVVASLSASGPANRFKESEVVNYVSLLKAGADAMREKIGHFSP